MIYYGQYGRPFCRYLQRKEADGMQLLEKTVESQTLFQGKIVTLKVDKVLRRHKLLQGIFLAVLLVITIAYMVDATNSPFLYFRF